MNSNKNIADSIRHIAALAPNRKVCNIFENNVPEDSYNSLINDASSDAKLAEDRRLSPEAFESFKLAAELAFEPAHLAFLLVKVQDFSYFDNLPPYEQCILQALALIGMANIMAGDGMNTDEMLNKHHWPERLRSIIVERPSEARMLVTRTMIGSINFRGVPIIHRYCIQLLNLQKADKNIMNDEDYRLAFLKLLTHYELIMDRLAELEDTADHVGDFTGSEEKLKAKVTAFFKSKKKTPPLLRPDTARFNPDIDPSRN